MTYKVIITNEDTGQVVFESTGAPEAWYTAFVDREGLSMPIDLSGEVKEFTPWWKDANRREAVSYDELLTQVKEHTEAFLEGPRKKDENCE